MIITFNPTPGVAICVFRMYGAQHLDTKRKKREIPRGMVQNWFLEIGQYSVNYNYQQMSLHVKRQIVKLVEMCI